MKKLILTAFLLLSLLTLSAQIQVLKYVGKDADEYRIGWGAFLKFSLPASESDYITFEGAFNILQLKDHPEHGIYSIPIKLGYRYTANRGGTGLYFEPQLGYNVAGIKPIYNGYDYDEPKITGPVGALHLGYLFEPGNKIQFDLSTYIETIVHKGGSTSYIGLRLSHSFGFGRRDY